MAVVIASAISPPAIGQDYRTIVSAPDRSDADRNTDKRRDPLKLLAFVGVKQGMKVLDMEAGAGYTTELLRGPSAPLASSTRRTQPMSSSGRSRTSSIFALRNPR